MTSNTLKQQLTALANNQTGENQPPATIGIFDSGVGGLSIAKCIRQHLPQEQLVYVADSAYAPYGDKGVELITERVNLIAGQLIKLNAKALVIACNTATVNAIDQLRAQVALPVIGVEPAIKPAAKHSKSKKVALLVTSATATNQRFLSLVEKYSVGVEVFIQPCPGLVELIEQGKLNSPECTGLLQQYLHPLMTQGIDTLVLGCTHYPFLLEKIQLITGPGIKVIETATPVTRELKRQLDRHQLCAPKCQNGNIRFFTSSFLQEAKQTSEQVINREQYQLFSQLWQGSVSLEELAL
ncbi:glutamate racemase [Thalassomonas sp. RHCl1]|uniref:glutamate racemase n=1 Tax=Thalassomonas sp. RHCl1 TaxID=2995320 RepID=UPI00248C71A1|nr:glutamate racemase [Thalassomonas sp. RHCl1]